MATFETTVFETTVKKALRSQKSLINNGEHCSADPQMLLSIGKWQGDSN